MTARLSITLKTVDNTESVRGSVKSIRSSVSGMNHMILKRQLELKDYRSHPDYQNQ